MDAFTDSLSFKHKIITGFSVLSSILILGMGYMLFEFTHVASLGTAIIERHQPVTNAASKALKLTQSASSQLHQYILTDGLAGLDKYPASLDRLRATIQTLQTYAEDSTLSINRTQLARSSDIINEISEHTTQIVELNQHYEQNHPIITSASSLLNPLALEYLGLINQIIEANTDNGTPVSALLLLADIRHSWSQLMSNLRVSLATRTINEIGNVTAYIDVNLQQTDRLKKMGLDLGLEGVTDLERIRDAYLENLDTVIGEFSTSVWRRDAHIMATIVMPLFLELESYLNTIANIQTTITESAGAGLASELDSAGYAFIAIICIGLAFALFFSIFITHSLHRPLAKLVSATEAVAMGNLNTNIETSGHDEIAQLINSFNDMVAKLRETQAALTGALQEAEKASKAKTLFLSSMSHELRTPLNAILGFAQLLELDLNKNQASAVRREAHLNFARKITRAGHHLLNLINGLLDLSRIEEGHLKLELEPVVLHDAVLECITQIEAGLASQRNIALIERSTDIHLRVWADHMRLCQVLSNLMSNAVKYNHDSGSVTVETALRDNAVLRISIIDTGTGIAEQDIDKLFDPFERLAFSNGTVEGTGIGLTVTRQLVEAMGGTIGVDSHVGEGSTFWVELPMYNETNASLSARSASAPHYIPASLETSSAAKRRVLYIEDNPESAQLVVDALDRVGNFEVKTVMTAEQGISIAQAQRQDIILMDINLAGLDGIAAIKQLRAMEQTRAIPVIAISANAMDADIREGREAGFDEYLTKPINIKQLYSVIDRY